MRAVLVADAVDRDAGLLGDFLRESRMSIRYLDRAALAGSSAAADVVVLLGSNRSAHDPWNAGVVAAEVALIRQTLDQGVPVIGICYGAQVLARALGGGSRRGAIPECGWLGVESDDEQLCPSGYWAQMHHDVIVPAPTSRVIGRSVAGPQAFLDDSRAAKAIGWQFHPELTPPTLERWMRLRYSGSEEADRLSTLADAARRSADSETRAAVLFQAAFQYLDVANHVLGVD